MTRYATYFFIATPPPCFFSLFSESPYAERNENGQRISTSVLAYRAGFSPLFWTLLLSIDKNKFRTLRACYIDIHSDRWWFVFRNKNSCRPFSFSERDSAVLAFLLEAISYRVSRAELSCCSTRSSLLFCLFLPVVKYGNKNVAKKLAASYLSFDN